MRTLIVATDFSKDATTALEYAATIAKQINAKVILYHAFMLPGYYSEANAAVEELVNEKKAQLELLSCQMANKYRIETDWSCSFGNVCFELDEQVKKYQADVVVMGMGGDSLERKLFGNSTTTLIRHAKFPVLVVPGDIDLKEVDRVLFACDLNCRFSLQSLKMLNEMAHSLHAQVQVLHIESVKKEESSLEAVGDAPAWSESVIDVEHSHKEIESNNVIKGIETGVKEFNADLLVMVPQRYGFWNNLIHKSKTCEMAARTRVPLLSIPNYN